MKKLNRAKVIDELKLLAAGANGASVVLDDDYFQRLQNALYPEQLARFANAVQDTFFGEFTRNELQIFCITGIELWKDFDTLADAILAERKRLDAAKKQEGK